VQSTVSGEKQEPRFANNITVITIGGGDLKLNPATTKRGG